MNICEQVDDEILSFFTKISHKFQRLTGRTNFFLAKCCISVFGIGLLLHIANYWFHFLNHKTKWTDFIFLILVPFLLLDTKALDEVEEKKFSSEAAQKPFLYTCWHGYLLRLFALAIAFLMLGLIILTVIDMVPIKSKLFEIIDTVSGWPAIACYNYFSIVVPLPPGKSKIREWIENFANIFQEPVAVKDRN